jgi:hypothetical protein
MRRNALLRRFSLTVAALTLLVAVGCEPSGNNGVTNTVPGGSPVPPPPPGATAAPPGVTIHPPQGENQPAATTEDTDGLPAELIEKINALIKAHQDYSAAAAQVQDSATAKERYDELQEIAYRGSDALDDVMIESKKLSAGKQAAFTSYMDRHVTPVNDARRKHQERVQGLLR